MKSNIGKGKLIVASFGTIVGLYALLMFLLIIIFELLEIGLEYLLFTAVIVLLLDFLFAPFFMDITLNLFYKIKWRNKNDIPEYVVDFIESICKEKNIPFPKFGVIDDNSPNAFTYGRTPKSARIVVTKGTILMLSRDELKAVIAHEMGHVVHWDMLLMTVVQLVPVVTYSIARTFFNSLKRKSRGSNSDKSDAIKVIIAVVSYIIYIVSEYIILWFSRVREYYADNFAGQITGNPNYLASALIKIGFGLKCNEDKNSKANNLSALGICDDKSSKTLGIVSERETGNFDSETLKNISRWDLWNPWATLYEINSTHPLISKRLQKLSEQAENMRLEPIYYFDKNKPESYADDFLKELGIMFMPCIICILGIICSLIFVESEFLLTAIFGVLALTFGASLLKTIYKYPTKLFNIKQVSDLLQEVKVSGVTPVPCNIKGKLIGKGNPGYAFSEDFVLEDETGIIYLDYAQPLSLWNGLFGLLKANQYIDKDVELKGWYRRAPIPYIEIKEMNVDGKTVKCYSYNTQIVFTIIMIILMIGLAIFI